MIYISILLTSLFSFGDCVGPDGSPMLTGDSMTFFKTQYRPENGSCEGAVVVCEADGYLSAQSEAESGSRSIASVTPSDYKYLSCLDEKTCENPFGPERLTDGISVVAYKTPEPPCIKETRVCDGATGELSGSFYHNICFEKNYVEKN